MLEVHEINSLDELAGPRATWADLLDQTPGGTFFQSLAWLETYWRFFGPTGTTPENNRLRVLVVETERKPIGIVPLVVTIERRRIGAVRVLGYPLHGWGSFYGPIGADPATALTAALEHIRNTPRDWDLIDLRWVDSQTDQSATPQAFHSAGLGFERQVWHESAQIELASGWDNYWGNRKPKWRSNVRRCERLLSKQGRLEHVRYRPLSDRAGDADLRWDLYDACVELARLSWQGSSTTGTTLSHAAVQDYLRAAHATAASAGAVDLNLLLLNDRPIAFAYNFHYRGWVYGVRSGFDSTAANDGAGNVLMAKMLEDSCRRGDHLFDLGPNYLDCKRNWFTRLQPAYHFTHFHPSGMRAQALRLKRAVKRWLGTTKRFGEGLELDIDANKGNMRMSLKTSRESEAQIVEARHGDSGRAKAL
jgi:CelD/BcsL family acetyltransferase involved in cellulose biosynthesis